MLFYPLLKTNLACKISKYIPQKDCLIFKCFNSVISLILGRISFLRGRWSNMVSHCLNSEHYVG